jgi:amino acid transporter
MVYGIAAIVSLVIHLIISGMVARAAMRKGRSYAAFFWLSFFFSWIIMSIIVATMQPISSAQYTTGSGTRKCPRCAEWISTEATLCKHCKSDVEPISEEDEPLVQEEAKSIRRESVGKTRAVISYIFGGLILVVFVGGANQWLDKMIGLVLGGGVIAIGYFGQRNSRRK